MVKTVSRSSPLRSCRVTRWFSLYYLYKSGQKEKEEDDRLLFILSFPSDNDNEPRRLGFWPREEKTPSLAMAPSRIQKALGSVKDHTSISLAKVASSTMNTDLDIAIVKATRHGEHPAEEKYIREIQSLTCYSRMHITSCVNAIAKRLTKTRSWAVALKCLVLIHRLLNEGDPAYEQEVFFSTRRGTRLLNLSDFRDTTGHDCWDFSAFVRTFAMYLDEHLEFRMQGRRVFRARTTSACRDDELESVGPTYPPL